MQWYVDDKPEQLKPQYELAQIPPVHKFMVDKSLRNNHGPHKSK